MAQVGIVFTTAGGLTQSVLISLPIREALPAAPQPTGGFAALNAGVLGQTLLAA